MSFKTPPVPKDVQELVFKQSSIHQISENFTSVPTSCNLVAADGKRGLLYVGHKNKITVLKLGNEANIEWKIDLQLPDIISRLSLSCDFSYLAVTLSAPAVLIYSAAALSKNVLDLLHEIRLSTSSGDIVVRDLCWNPAVSGMLCTIASDYTIGSFQVKGDRTAGVGITALERIEGIEALSLSWSPKGKQIVVGCRNGNIIQLKPELKPARTIAGPNPSIGGVTAILWVSNYQFCAAYQEPGEQRINVLIVDAPKGEALAIFTNYEDITYGGVPTTRYYFESIPEWGVIFAASSTSSEIAVLGSIDNGNSWEQWQLVDSGRAELPLVRTDESFPVGLAIDRSANRRLLWGPESTLPNPVPVIHILGTSGQLCSFHIVNLKPDCPAVCAPPSEIVAPPPVSACIQGPRPSIASSEISFNLATGATSTPRSKADSPKEKAKNMLTSLIQDTAKAPPAFAPRPEPTNPAPLPQIETKIPSFVQQPDPKPTNFPPPVEIKIPQPRIEKTETEANIQVFERKEIPKEPVHQEKPSIDEGLCLRAYREEQANFEKELKARLEPLIWEVGTTSERGQLVEKTALIDEFLRDLQETTSSLSSDVAYLKALLLQSFAWLEETKSKNAKGVKLSTRGGRESSKLAELQRFFYYTQSQLVQASQVLDLEWSEQQSREQNKLKIPNMEFIYQSLMRHGQILTKEKSNLENLVRKWKMLVRGGTVSLNRSLSNLHITNNFGNDSAIDLRCKAIAGKRESFSREKQNKLRDLLSENAPRIIKAAKPTLIQDRLEATLTSLAFSSPKVPKAKVLEASQKKSSPLASLNNIVSKIGTPGKEEANLQKIVPTFAAKSPLTMVSQKPKIQQNQQVPVQQSQQSSQVSNLAKPFSKVDAIPFGQKTDENQKEKTEKAPKVSSISGTLQGNSGSMSTPTVPPFSSTAAQSFSFASKPPTNLPSFPAKPQEEKSNLDLGGLNLSLQSSGLSISLVPETKPVSTPAMSSINFGKASVSPSAAFGQSSTTFGTPGTTLGNSGSIFGKNGNQTIFGNQGSIFGGGSNLKTTFSTTGVATTVASATVASSASSPASVSSLISKPASVTSPNPLTSTPVSSPTSASSPISVPSLMSSLVSSPPVPVSSPPVSSPPVSSPPVSSPPVSSPPVSSLPAYGATTPISSPSATSAPDMFSLNLGSPKPSSAETASFSPTPSISASKPSSTATTTTSSLTSSIFSTAFGNSKLASSASTLNFGTATALSSTTSITPVFGKEPTSTPGSIFGSSTISAGNVFGGSATTPATASPFGGSTLPQNSIFGNATSPGGSIFGGGTTAATTTAFGAGTTAAPATAFGGATKAASTPVFGGTTPASSTVFGGGTPAAAGAAFGMKTPGTGSVFGMSSQNPVFGAPASTTSVFGGASKPQEANFSMFGGSTTPAFGQAPAFGGKPAFGGSPDFGQAKPAFGTGFGGTAAFGGSPASPGFGSPPMMGASPPPIGSSPMQKVFGGSSGSNTFETLATQSGGLSFSSLAQSSPEQQQQQQQQQSPPEFAAKSSFSSWR
ncbi:nuclear pore complex protein Nup214-like isoform X2 [Belonocnema kinseyi]|uniref:nuclear pore complex protein Nup214-like isoform X2 n=1 Tax=Belonocnema kinseyi TaxID=2817044 RepID=UPI00143DFE33|nr:nuclear pore complex protein Nup214-like isoform X2 [Belonocnema kinseyi]